MKIRAFGLVVAALLLPTVALAQGAIPLNSTSPIKSGDAASWMNQFSDWLPVDGVLNPKAGNYAIPTATSPVTLVTQRTGTALVFTFTIPDRTHRTPGNTSLTIGDKVIIQLDPDASRGTEIATAASASATDITADYRYEVTIKDNALSSATRRVRVAGSPNVWLQSVNLQTSPTLGVADLQAFSPDYILQITIPLTSIGSPAGDIGLALAVINDLGNTHMEGGVNVTDLTGVSFPFGSMPLSTSPSLDPGLIPTGVPAAGPWVKPSQWGTGYLTAPATELQLSLAQGVVWWYFARSIKLGVCNAARWEDIPAAPDSGLQAGLANWYEYNAGHPCKMALWVNVHNAGATIARARVLGVWADAGSSPASWRFIDLTPVVAFVPGDSAVKISWDIPSGLTTTHACQRVYVLPEMDNPTFPEASIRGISTPAQLSAFETAYGFNAGAAAVGRAAQMNFTNFSATADCPTAACKIALLNHDVRPLAVSLLSLLSPPVLYAQPREPRPAGDVIQAIPVRDGDTPPRGPSGDWIRVTVAAHLFPATPPTSPYVFLADGGGVGWGIQREALGNGDLKLTFNVTNPAIEFRDFSQSPAVDIPSPVQRVVLTTKVEAAPGRPVPTIRLAPLSQEVLNPGQTVPAAVTIVGGGPGPGGIAWWWLLLLLLILLIIAALIWRRTHA